MKCWNVERQGARKGIGHAWAGCPDLVLIATVQPFLQKASCSLGLRWGHVTANDGPRSAAKHLCRPLSSPLVAGKICTLKSSGRHAMLLRQHFIRQKRELYLFCDTS